MEYIRDDGGTVIEPFCYKSAKQFLDTCRLRAEKLRLDRTEGQETRLVVICEAAGMAPQLARVADPFGVKVMSGGGFESLTGIYKFAEEIWLSAAQEKRPTEVLHIGDHDPSGTHIFLAFQEDVEAFTRDLGGEATFTRLAVIPEQIERYRLPTAPPKKGDKRAFTGETCQAEALAPDDLAAILREAIEARIDQRIYESVLRRERAVRRELIRKLEAGR
jgi:hypothetical protein